MADCSDCFPLSLLCTPRIDRTTLQIKVMAPHLSLLPHISNKGYVPLVRIVSKETQNETLEV